jgi:hypothetical protein
MLPDDRRAAEVEVASGPVGVGGDQVLPLVQPHLDDHPQHLLALRADRGDSGEPEEVPRLRVVPRLEASLGEDVLQRPHRARAVAGTLGDAGPDE